MTCNTTTGIIIGVGVGVGVGVAVGVGYVNILLTLGVNVVLIGIVDERDEDEFVACWIRVETEVIGNEVLICTFPLMIWIDVIEIEEAGMDNEVAIALI